MFFLLLFFPVCSHPMSPVPNCPSVRPSVYPPDCPALVPVLKLSKYKAVVNIPDTQTPERYVPWIALNVCLASCLHCACYYSVELLLKFVLWGISNERIGFLMILGNVFSENLVLFENLLLIFPDRCMSGSVKL